MRSATRKRKTAPPPSVLEFAILGPPQPKQRARRGRTRDGRVIWYTPVKTKSYEYAVKVAALVAVRQLPKRERDRWNCDASFRAEVFAYFPDARRRDADNVGKAVLDACNQVLWGDDSQVSTLTVHRSIDRERPRTVVRVEVLP